MSAFPDGDDIFHWVGTIEGGAGTVRRRGARLDATQSSALTPRPAPAPQPYESLSFKLSLVFHAEYPFKAVRPPRSPSQPRAAL